MAVFDRGYNHFLSRGSSILFDACTAVQTKKWFRPNGWFTDREVGIVVNRVLRDDPSKSLPLDRNGIPSVLIDDKGICITERPLRQ
jgi:hypothetical protein